VHVPYKLSRKVIDWKQKWFYIGNHGNTLAEITPGPPTIRHEWKRQPVDDRQIQDLHDWIADLKHDKITRETVDMDWMKHRIKPLQACQNFGFEYQGISDPSRFSTVEISYGEALRCVQRVPVNLNKVPHIPDTFSVINPPTKVCVKVVDSLILSTFCFANVGI